MHVPDAEIDVDEALVRRLLLDQHPDLAGLPLRPLAEGWDNVVLRLGDELLVRVPRREAAAHLVEHEQRWLPGIAARVRHVVAVPEPVRIGRPSAVFPWSWTVTRWVAGRPAGASTDLPRDAPETLAAFLRALHVTAPEDALHNPVRGGPLNGRTTAVARRLRSGRIPRTADLERSWTQVAAAPAWQGPALWLHGDLHPFNIVVDDHALVAVVDFGDLTAGDPATDLATAWLTFGREARQRFRAALAPDDDTWTRARGWAMSIATALAASPDGSDQRAAGLRALEAVLDD
ncbi:aminoglycoside phosphotransferase family protein [Curtobacterium sp. MCBD17_003]|uniref:aminoglycoside phosphotransferase family protein n=1 Tax=Curtobacterium sp. MCBD17_003 TaxID=2175667 RepID=UPI000DA98EC4|nr:aminoglycoside phosphotransferase family protein [Curtobacterium sp. MCBD17_003]WIE54525.1 aminoglycoside phosphotransferase family protein [Curtobacterium sp. MCBD17_003]